MNLRDPSTMLLGGLAAVLLFVPGRGFMGPLLFLGRPGFGAVVVSALVIFCVVYFGTVKLWHLLSGDPLPKPIRTILALWLAIRLTVDCARMMMWW